MEIVLLDHQSPKGRFFFCRIFPIPFIAVGLITLIFGFRDMHRAKESLQWPTSEGMVLFSSVGVSTLTDRQETYQGKVFYDYRIAGRSYEGTRIAFGEFASNDYFRANRITKKYPMGKTVAVYFDPGNPATSVLEPGFNGQLWFLPGFGMLFLSAGVLMAIFLPKLFRPAGSPKRTNKVVRKRRTASKVPV